MNSYPDSHKRTSISQLLNPSPLGASHDPPAFPSGQLSAPVGPVPSQHEQQGIPPFQPGFNSGASFHLRAASWDQVPDDATKRKPDNGTTSARQYHHPHLSPADVYGDHAARAARPRMDDSNSFAIEGTVWPPSPHDIANMAYGAPAISPMYSDERTGGWHLAAYFYRLLLMAVAQPYRVTMRRTVRYPA